MLQLRSCIGVNDVSCTKEQDSKGYADKGKIEVRVK